MGRAMLKIERDQRESVCVNDNDLTQQIIHELKRCGVREFCLAPGSRNASLVYALTHSADLKVYTWYEERSAAFFALGRIKATGRPVAVVTTSGTAAAECLPATMEAHYLGLPLVLVTADRPRHYRCSGAPQTAEQVNLFGVYAHFEQDLACGERCDFSLWKRRGPAHLNVCYEEPDDTEVKHARVSEVEADELVPEVPVHSQESYETFHAFIKQVKYPVVIVSTLPSSCQKSILPFLLKLQCPIYVESIAGIRENKALDSLRINCIDQAFHLADKNDYPIDGVLRLGGVPTCRFWRDLQEKEGKIPAFCISEQPFSGLSWGGVLHTSLDHFFTTQLENIHPFPCRTAHKFLKADQDLYHSFIELFHEFPLAEPSLIHSLSKVISRNAFVYLGNSLPIREWDLAASLEDKKFHIGASRGLNGIDGQISTFLGMCDSERENWALLGDLTTLYDMAGPWILKQLQNVTVNIVVVNNGGGKIFAKKYSHSIFQNMHAVQFKPLADLWNLNYEKWETIPKTSPCLGNRLIELVPDPIETDSFWKKMVILCKKN